MAPCCSAGTAWCTSPPPEGELHFPRPAAHLPQGRARAGRSTVDRYLGMVEATGSNPVRSTYPLLSYCTLRAISRPSVAVAQSPSVAIAPTGQLRCPSAPTRQSAVAPTHQQAGARQQSWRKQYRKTLRPTTNSGKADITPTAQAVGLEPQQRRLKTLRPNRTHELTSASRCPPSLLRTQPLPRGFRRPL